MFHPGQSVHKHPLIVGLRSFSNDSDEFLKEAPYAFGYGKLDDTVGRYVKKSYDGLFVIVTYKTTGLCILFNTNRFL